MKKKNKEGGMMPGNDEREEKIVKPKIESDPDKCEPARLNKRSKEARRECQIFMPQKMSQNLNFRRGKG